MLELGLKVTLAYWLGSVLGGLVVGRLYGGRDLRTVGSGNIGATNALRAYGRQAAIWTVLVDAGKGIVAAAVLPGLSIPGIGIDPAVDRALLLYAVAFAAILGHVFPIWSEFRGGKGGATAAGLLCFLAPAAAVPVLGLWVLIVYLTRYVGLATMSACIGAAVLFGAALSVDALDVVFIGVAESNRVGLFVFACLVAVLVLYTHRGNIRRMRSGTENRFGRTVGSR